MPRESNFFEEAMVLCGDSDSHVARLAECLYRRMFEENRQRGRSPAGAFNILYFIQTAIHVWLSRHPDVKLADTKFPMECEAVNGINWPAPVPAENSILRDFVCRVQADSVPTGDPFDVAYATEIMALSFDDDDAIRPHISTEQGNVDFDYWLSGFNSNQLPEPPFDESEKDSKRVKN